MVPMYSFEISSCLYIRTDVKSDYTTDLVNEGNDMQVPLLKDSITVSK